MISVKSNNISLKYQRFTPSGCKDIRIRKFKFVAKTQFLWENINFVPPEVKSKLHTELMNLNWCQNSQLFHHLTSGEPCNKQIQIHFYSTNLCKKVTEKKFMNKKHWNKNFGKNVPIFWNPGTKCHWDFFPKW